MANVQKPDEEQFCRQPFKLPFWFDSKKKSWIAVINEAVLDVFVLDVAVVAAGVVGEVNVAILDVATVDVVVLDGLVEDIVKFESKN